MICDNSKSKLIARNKIVHKLNIFVQKKVKNHITALLGLRTQQFDRRKIRNRLKAHVHTPATATAASNSLEQRGLGIPKAVRDRKTEETNLPTANELLEQGFALDCVTESSGIEDIRKQQDSGP